VSEELALVLAQIERIRAITRSLLQYSRPGDYETAPVAAPHPHHRGEPDPGALRPAPAAGEPGGRSQAQQPIEADRQQLLQVLINLWSTPAMRWGAGEIRVESRDWLDDAGQLQGAEVRVIDNGSGIEAAIIDKIFDPSSPPAPPAPGWGWP
jgi:two-component system NtrC family sensor kinase